MPLSGIHLHTTEQLGSQKHDPNSIPETEACESAPVATIYTIWLNLGSSYHSVPTNTPYDLSLNVLCILEMSKFLLHVDY